ncbi:hypothetical protein FRIGORI9N_470037 [Frigoribacterium sp. 9N]|nr:hypothetical protein FRIGORI9N_470037 [Frigoribacterium sp. 9N]
MRCKCLIVYVQVVSNQQQIPSSSVIDGT